MTSHNLTVNLYVNPNLTYYTYYTY